MKQHREITPAVCVSALRHFWKRVLAITLLATLLGAGASYWYVSRSDFSRASGASISTAPLEYEPVVVTANYYADRQTLLQTAAGNLKTLLSALSPYAASPTTEGRTPAQEKLEALSSELTALRENDLGALDNQIALLHCYPEKLIDNRLLALERKLADADKQLLLSTEAVELLKTMDAPEQANEATLSEYNILLARARNLGDARLTVEQLQLEQAALSDRASILADNRTAESLFDTVEAQIEVLYAQIQTLIEPLAAKQNLIFTAGVGVDPEAEDRSLYTLYVTHTNRAVSPAEDIAAVTVFCALCGVCFGFFAALCGETRRAAKSGETPEQV